MAKDFGRVHFFQVNSIVCSEDSQWLFTSDNFGIVKQWRVGGKDGEGGTGLFKDFGKVHDCILAVAVGGGYLFSGDDEGCVKMWSVEDGTLVKDFGQCQKEAVTAIGV